MRAIEQRLARLEQAGSPPETLVVFIHLVPAERTLPATATIDGRLWRREANELEDTFLSRVASEAGPARPGCGAVVAFLD